jgi:hypothetical protein
MGPLPDGTIQIDGTDDLGIFIESGFSGAAVWDTNLRGVVGMISSRNLNPAERVAYMIPVRALKQAWQPLRITERANERRPSDRADRNRRNMIEKVRTIWITGFLEKSLFQETRLILGLSDESTSVARPMDVLVQRHGQVQQLLPVGTDVEEVYDQTTDHALLILGEPGSGKSTLLLELTRELLERADRDPDYPIPVVFPLTTWAQSRKPIAEWLADELNLRYYVPTKLARDWVTADQILPLLDGLDEVKADHRAACVRATNDFRRDHGLLPLVITSRTTEYEELEHPLHLQGAIQTRPVTRDQVNVYLDELGPAGDPLRSELRADPSYWDLLDTPLTLNIALVASQGQSQIAPASGSMEDRRDRLFGSYVDHMLRRRAVEHRYTPEQTIHWLSWLARQMVERAQTVFYLERMQYDWLPEPHRRTAHLASGILPGLVFAAVIALVIGLVGGRFAGAGFGLAAAFVNALLLASVMIYDGIQSENIVCSEAVTWSLERFKQKWKKWLLVGLIGSAICIPVVGLTGALAIGLAGGLSGALSGGWTPNEKQVELRILPNQGIRQSLFNSLKWGLFGGTCAALIQGLICAFVGRSLAGDSGMKFGALMGGLYGAVFGAVSMAMNNGGSAVAKHVVLRYLLVRENSIPVHYVEFLDHAAERILLRKVGGGYAFIHRMLLEHFASRNAPGASPVRREQSPVPRAAH